MVCEICFKARFFEDWQDHNPPPGRLRNVGASGSSSKVLCNKQISVVPCSSEGEIISKMSLRDLTAVLVGTENTQMGGSSLLGFLILSTWAQDINCCWMLKVEEASWGPVLLNFHWHCPLQCLLWALSLIYSLSTACSSWHFKYSLLSEFWRLQFTKSFKKKKPNPVQVWPQWARKTSLSISMHSRICCCGVGRNSAKQRYAVDSSVSLV